MRRAVLAGVVALGLVSVVALGWALAGGGGLQPCRATPGSSLSGFDDVVGPVPFPGPSAYGEAGGEGCSYQTAGLGSENVGTAAYSRVAMVRVPRAAVDADPALSTLFTTPVSSRISNSSTDYPFDLVRSGVPMLVSQGPDSAALAATCVDDDDYWSVLVASQGRDDSTGLDELLVALGCRRIGTS